MSEPQIFKVDPISSRYNFIKFTVLETFGSSKTYINNVFLFEEYIDNLADENIDNMNINNKFRSASPNATNSKLRQTNRDSDNISSYETLNTLRSNQFIMGTGTGTASTHNTYKNNNNDFTN